MGAKITRATGVKARQRWSAPGWSASISKKRGIPGWAGGQSSGNQALTAGRLYFVPIYLDKARTFQEVSLRVVVAGAGGTLVRIGCYTYESDGSPGTLEFDAGTVAVSSEGSKYITGLSEMLPAGYHYLCYVTDGTPSVRAYDPANLWLVPVTGMIDTPVTWVSVLIPATNTQSALVAGGLPASAPAPDTDAAVTHACILMKEA